MNSEPSNIFWITLIILMIPILTVYFKFHRRQLVLFALILFSLINLFIGYYLLKIDKSIKDVALTNFYSPILYILSYQALRFIFKWKYKFEPAYEYSSTYDITDNRKLIFWDYIVFVFPIVFSMGLPIFLN